MSQARSVSKPICCASTIVHVQTESWEFQPASKMKESNHLKTHKTQVSVVGPCEETHLALQGCYSQRAQLPASVYVCMCGVRACEKCVLTLVMSTVFGPSWEICSKLNFKQTWVCLMRCWSEVQVWSHKGKGIKEAGEALPAETRSTHGTVSSQVWGAVERFRSPVDAGKWEQ